MIPAVAAEGLARFADVFCEPGVFTVDEVARVAHRGARGRTRHQAARRRARAGRRRRARGGAARDVGRSPRGDQRRRHRGPRLRRHRRHASSRARCSSSASASRHRRDASSRPACRSPSPRTSIPGRRRRTNFPLVLTLGRQPARLSAGESIVAATVNGAAALALAERTGQLAPGFSADLALCGHRATFVSCRIGSARVVAWLRGRAANLVTPMT